MFTLFTDTDCDVTPEFCEKYNFQLISMPYVIDGKEVKPYVDFNDFNFHEFYERLRKGTIPKTFAINPYDYVQYFEPSFKEGKDILYVHFSKAMSGTFNALNIALDELKERYPERTCYMIDTKGISILGFQIVKAVGELVKEGKSIEEIMKWSETEVNHFAVYFFATDLKFFQRSGRVSGMSAFFGQMLGIHPLIYVGEDGKMATIGKVRGKSAAIKKLVDYVEELGDHIEDYPIMIAQADALDIAEKLKEMLIERFGNKLDIWIVPVNPTIGSHCGPTSIGVSFHSIHR